MGLVQHASNSANTGTSLTATFGANTTVANCLIAAFTATTGGGTLPTVSSVHIGGVADNFASAKEQTEATSSTRAAVWTDQNCQQAATALAITVSTSSGMALDAYEWSGVKTSAALDKTNSASATSSPWSSGSTGTLTQSVEVVFGSVGVLAQSGTPTITGPGAPWTNEPQISFTGGSSNAGQMSGYQQVGATTALTYNGTVTGTNPFNAAVIITLELVTGPAAPFTPPQRAPRGAPGARRGRVTSSRGAPVSPTPSPFTPPRRAPRGAPGARRGRTPSGLSSPGAPVTPTPAPFTPPRRAPRGAPGARRGRTPSGLSSPGAPINNPRQLLISLASAGGTDDYGFNYPRGILATDGIIQGPTFIGPDYILNATGAYFYSSSPPASGNLSVSVVPGSVAVLDPEGNTAEPGITIYQAGGFPFAQLISGILQFIAQAGQTAPGVVGTFGVAGQCGISSGQNGAADSPANVIALSKNASGAGASQIGLQAAQLTGAINTPQPHVSGFPVSGSATLATTITALNALWNAGISAGLWS